MADFGPPRRSQTLAQQCHEAALLAQHYPSAQQSHDIAYLSHNDNNEPDTTPRPKHHHGPPARLPGQFPSTSIHPGLKGKLKSFWNGTIVPAFPEAVGDISLIKNSLRVEDELIEQIQNEALYPEIGQVAEVRRGVELCDEEKTWRDERLGRVKVAFCRYLGLDERKVDVRDVPVVGCGGSGGGYRAMIAVMGYAMRMRESGLWDLLMYVAGVSGSCWSLAAYYTWGGGDWERVVRHCEGRLSPFHPLSPEAVREVLHSEQGPALTLGPLVQKHYSGLETVAMDLYSVFTTGHLFLGSGDPAADAKAVERGPRTEVVDRHPEWLKWSSAVKHLAGGAEMLPILTAIRHERPWKDWADSKHPFREGDHDSEEHKKAVNAWYQWFEITPFEVGCDELAAWCPTWAFGRPFEHGRSTVQLPEQSLALLLGLCTSAPAGPLTSYLATIKRSLPPGFLGNSLMDMSRGIARLWGKQGKEEFQQHHPLDACNEHNFMHRLSEDETKEAPAIENAPCINLIDSGLDNNCPTYVLLHPARQVDVILNMDASSDVQKDSFQERVDQIGSRRGLKFTKRHHNPRPADNTPAANRFDGLYGQLYDGSVLESRPETVIDSYGHEVRNPPAPQVKEECTMVYLPLLPNEGVVPDFDPSTAKFSGSYNLVWTSEQIDMLMKVSLANCVAAEGVIKKALLDAYQKKKARRESREMAQYVKQT